MKSLWIRRSIEQLDDEEISIIPIVGGAITIIDAEDYNRLSKYIWYLSGDNYVSTPVGDEWWYIHRLILNIYPGDKRYVDHRDFNHLNNCKYNLCVCSSMQSGRNRRRHKDSKSKYKGVMLHRNKFMARIEQDYLGLYNTELEAAIAYNVAALQRFGEFAQLNLV